MKKPTLYILGGILFLSMAANAWQYVAHQSQVAQQATILADLQGQMESASQDLADAKMNLAKLEQDHATLLADIARLQTEKEVSNQQAPEKPVTPPTTSKPESKPVTPPASSKPEISKPVTPPASSKPSGGGNTSSGGGGTDLFGRPLDPGDDLKEEDYATGGTYN